MGLFDSKKTKEEKAVYQKLIELKDSSYELKNLLPSTSKEFLNFQGKVRLITIYKYTLEIIKRNDITQAFNLKNMGQCYDFVASYYSDYTIKQNRAKLCNQPIESDFMVFLESSIAVELMEYETKQEINKVEQETRKIEQENEKFIGDIEERLKKAYNSPTQKKLDDIEHQEAKKGDIEINQRKFDKKFPQYQYIYHAVRLNELGLGKDNPKVIAMKIYIDGVKDKIPNLKLDDFLIPYLDEKFKYGILTKDEERIYYSKKEDNLEMEAIKRLYCLYCNSKIFFKTKEEQKTFLDSFEECNKIIDSVYVNTNGMKR